MSLVGEVVDVDVPERAGPHEDAGADALVGPAAVGLEPVVERHSGARLHEQVVPPEAKSMMWSQSLDGDGRVQCMYTQVGWVR
jgi:hypothetical protein